jgi:hypothetical protein
MNRLQRTLAVALVALVGGCKRPPPPAPLEPTPAEKLVADMSLFVSHRSDPATTKETAQALVDGSLTIEAWVDKLLERRIDGNFAKDLLLGGSQGIKDLHPIPQSMILRSEKGPRDGERTLYWLRKKCDRAEAVAVKAWWGEDVVVCADAYRPDVKGDDVGRTCGASFLNPSLSEVCGCGPMLMWCTKDNAHWQTVKADVQREVTDTVAWVVNENLPIEKIFTMNETVRGPNAEAVYRRSRALAGEPPEKVFDRADWPKETKAPTPRHDQVPGQHAGILTAPSMIYGSDALRGVMRNYFDYLWCATNSASRVSTEAVLGLDVVDLRVGDGWKQLAGMNICTDCHARMDYGMQYFHGWPSSTMGIDYRPRDALKGRGPFYAANIKDLRGEEDLTPQGFAKLVVAQPEFGDCISRRVTDHVFNGSARPEDAKAVRKTFAEQHTLKGMLRTALVRYASAALKGRPPEPPSAPSTPDVVAAAADADMIKLPASLRRRLDNDCMECHDKDDAFDFNGEALPRQTLAHMLEQVGFGVMPKTVEGLPSPERRALVDELATVLFADPAERQTAIAWFGSAFRSHPVHRVRSSLDSVAQVAGKRPEESFRTIESAVEQSQMVFTPTMAVAAGVTAVRSCRTAHKDAAALAACIERASSPNTIVAGGL